MSTIKKLAVIAAVLSVVVPATSWACFPCLFGCGGCGMPWASCLCPPCITCHHPPAMCTCAVPVVPVVAVPIVQARYRQEQFVTYRDVPSVHVRREAYVENVPVTTYQPVTETVYVPQQVTKLVPQTAYQPQTRYRDVAYQVTQRVAETQTRFVPLQTASCAGSIGPTSYIAPPVPAASPTAALPSTPPITVSPFGANVPVPRYPDVPATNSSWRPMPSQSSSTPAARGAFRPAPSAATVWQSKF
jgi:hypothetical protein